MHIDFAKIYNGLKIKMFYALAAVFTIRYIFFVGLNITNNQYNLLVINLIGLAVFLSVPLFLYLKTERIKIATLILVYTSTISIFLPIFLDITGASSSMHLARDVAILNILLFITAFMTDRMNTVIFAILLVLSFITLKFGLDVYVYSSYNTYLIIFFIVAGCIIYLLLANLIESTLRMLLAAKLKTDDLLNFKRKITQFIFHDLHVLVNAIIELNSTANSSNSHKTTHYAQTIRRQLEDVLDIERLEEPEMIIKKENVLISEIIRNAELSVEVLARQKNMLFNYSFASSGYLYCDGKIMERVIINLLVNAIKYSDNNTEIRIAVNNLGPKCVISVKDQGIGIHKEHLGRIFDKFYRVEQPILSANTPSSGLGLTFCRLAVNSHGGTIKVISDEKQGSEFIVELPGFVACPETEGLTPKKWDKPFLTRSEKGQMNKHCLALSKIPTYRISEIIPILKAMEQTRSDNIKNWLEIVTHAVYSGNQEYYTALIKFVLEDTDDTGKKDTNC